MSFLSQNFLMLVSFLLLCISAILFTILLPIGLLFTLYEIIRKRSLKKVTYYLSEIFKQIAILIDILGNVLCSEFLNRTLLKKGGYLFGRRNETISSVLGKNLKRKSLSKTGIWLVGVLDYRDKDHCLNHIIDDSAL